MISDSALKAGEKILGRFESKIKETGAVIKWTPCRDDVIKLFASDVQRAINETLEKEES